MNIRIKRVAKATPRYVVTVLLAAILVRLFWPVIAAELPQAGVSTGDELSALAALVICSAVAFVLLCQLPGIACALLGESSLSDRESTT
jgi:hypothetical protein